MFNHRYDRYMVNSAFFFFVRSFGFGSDVVMREQGEVALLLHTAGY